MLLLRCGSLSRAWACAALIGVCSVLGLLSCDGDNGGDTPKPNGPSTVNPPGPPSNPSPATGSTDVSTSLTLSWNAGSGATGHDVRLGAERGCDSSDKTECLRTAASGLSGTTYTPAPLENNMPYYWMVTARNSEGTSDGPLWRFTTGSRGSSLVADAGPDIFGENDRNLFFDGRRSRAPAGVADWIWDFGDGIIQSGILPQVRHRFSCSLKPPGSTSRDFTVRLTIVENGTGQRASDSAIATVSFIYGGC